MNDEKNIKCCAKCVWFDNRAGFCRINPPIPVLDSVNQRITSVFPKIQLPLLDFCSHYTSQKDQII